MFGSIEDARLETEEEEVMKGGEPETRLRLESQKLPGPLETKMRREQVVRKGKEMDREERKARIPETEMSERGAGGVGPRGGREEDGGGERTSTSLPSSLPPSPGREKAGEQTQMEEGQAQSREKRERWRDKEGRATRDGGKNTELLSIFPEDAPSESRYLHVQVAKVPVNNKRS
jgi:hypothetical protein